MIQEKCINNYSRYIFYSNGTIFNKHINKFMKISKNHNKKYCKVLLWNDFTQKYDNWLLHRIIATAFIPNPLNKPHINHKDNNGMNNDISNLEWCTPKENLEHAMKYGNFWSGVEKWTKRRKIEKMIKSHQNVSK